MPNLSSNLPKEKPELPFSTTKATSPLCFQQSISFELLLNNNQPLSTIGYPSFHAVQE